MSNKMEVIGATSATERAVGAVFAEAFGATSVNVNDSFFDLGGDSLLAVGLLLRLEEVLGRALRLDVLSERPTIRLLAEYLDSQTEDRRTDVVTIQAGNSQTALFCLPGAGGNVLDYHLLKKRLRPDQTIYALPTLGANAGETAHTTIVDLAAHAVERIRSVQPYGPYQLLGYSMGGVVAFEAARQLRAAGEEVSLLAMLDACLWSPPIELPLVQKLLAHWDALWRAPVPGKISYLGDRLRILRARLARRSFQRREEDFVNGLDLTPASRELAALHIRARQDYLPAIYDRPIVVFRVARKPSLATSIYEADPALGWAQWTTSDVIVHEVSGTHTALLHVPELSQLNDHLNAEVHRDLAYG
jgi:thioesterase domain-containing protein/acyl carrier protein